MRRALVCLLRACTTRTNYMAFNLHTKYRYRVALNVKRVSGLRAWLPGVRRTGPHLATRRSHGVRDASCRVLVAPRADAPAAPPSDVRNPPTWTGPRAAGRSGRKTGAPGRPRRADPGSGR